MKYIFTFALEFAIVIARYATQWSSVMLVSFFRNPILARVVGTVVALAFLLPLMRYKHGLKIALPLVTGIVIVLVIRGYLIKRKRRLTALEEEYLKKRFYQH